MLETIKAVLVVLGVSLSMVTAVIHGVQMSRPYVVVWQLNVPEGKPLVESFESLAEAKQAYNAIAKSDVRFKLLMDGTRGVVAKYGDLERVDEALKQCYAS
jgi:hypothetical protein